MPERDLADAMTIHTGSIALLEVRSWLPEHKTGAKSVTLEGRELPCEVGASLAGAIRALCLAPGEWLLVSEQQSAASIAERMAANLAEQGAVLVDTTDGFGVLTVSGPMASEVLAKGCGLDFHPSALPVGSCARTRFAQLSVIIEHLDDEPTFRCYVARSYQAFLAEWIEDAAVEFNNTAK